MNMFTRRILLLLAAALLAVAFAPRQLKASAPANADSREDPFQARDESENSYDLVPGARVEVSGINGPVEISPGEGPAVAHITRTARSQGDLAHHRITVTHDQGSLVIKGEEDHSRVSVRQHVVLTVPPGVSLTVLGVNGRVKVGAMEGPVEVHGVNGAVNVDKAMAYSNISGVNGAVAVALGELGEKGLHISGVNGAIEVRLADQVTAEIHVSQINGGVYNDIANVTIQGKWGPNDFHGLIGGGGPPIAISGVNGRVHMSRLE